MRAERRREDLFNFLYNLAGLRIQHNSYQVHINDVHMVGGKAIKGLGQGLPYLILTYVDWTYTKPKPSMGLH